MFRGLIFDFNGVLLWDSHLQEQAWREYSMRVRGNALTDDEMRVHIHGRTNAAIVAYLLGRKVSPEEAWAMGEQKEDIYKQLCLDLGDAFQLSPGAVLLLDALVSRNIPHTIATASGWGNVAFFIEHLELDHWFDVNRIVFDDGTRPGKPAPDIYQEAARQVGLSPAECVVVEDSDSGIAAAHAAGIGHVIALGPPESHARLLELDGVDTLVANLTEVDVGELFGARWG